MIAKANLVVGDTTFQFEFEEAKDMEGMNKAIAVANITTYCNVCKKEDSKSEFELTTNRDKEGNIYVNLKHTPCNGKVKLGQYKQGGYFWHREFEVYKPANKTHEELSAEDYTA